MRWRSVGDCFVFRFSTSVGLWLIQSWAVNIKHLNPQQMWEKQILCNSFQHWKVRSFSLEELQAFGWSAHCLLLKVSACFKTTTGDSPNKCEDGGCSDWPHLKADYNPVLQRGMRCSESQGDDATHFPTVSSLERSLYWHSIGHKKSIVHIVAHLDTLCTVGTFVGIFKNIFRYKLKCRQSVF